MINLVPLNYEDTILLEHILSWRNDETTRNNSNNTNVITQEIFNKMLVKYKESEIDPLIIYKNEVPVGIITFVNSNDKIFIGINLSPQYRGQNLGSESLNFLINNSHKYFKSDIKIYAQVKKINTPSIKLFAKFFEFEEDCDDNIIFYKNFST